MTWGWWLAPALVTVIVILLLAWYWWDMNRATQGYYNALDTMIGVFLTTFGAFVIAVAWLIWGLLN